MYRFEGSHEEGVSEARRKSERSEEPYGSATSTSWGSEKIHVREEISTSKPKPEAICYPHNSLWNSMKRYLREYVDVRVLLSLL